MGRPVGQGPLVRWESRRLRAGLPARWHRRNRATHGGKQITWESLYREIVTDERIVYTSVLAENDTPATVSLTTIEFVPEGEGTRLVLVEAGAYLDGREQPAWREEGTSKWLDALGTELTARIP